MKDNTHQPPANALPHSKTYRVIRRVLMAGVLSIAGYGLASYGALPTLWKFYEAHHPALALAETRAFTAQGIPGDPINIAFIGTQADLMQAAESAGWVPADPITWGSSVKIVIDSAVHRAYANAPVSDLFVHGKKQDIAFEQPHGPDPSKRHHARFWKCDQMDVLGRPLWLGAATFDSKVGVSHLTGQVTHHIDANVDKERDKIAADLVGAAKLSVQWIEGFQRERHGKNGGSDPFFTDGRLWLAVVNSYSPLDSAQIIISSAFSFLDGDQTPHK